MSGAAGQLLQSSVPIEHRKERYANAHRSVNKKMDVYVSGSKPPSVTLEVWWSVLRGFLNTDGTMAGAAKIEKFYNGGQRLGALRKELRVRFDRWNATVKEVYIVSEIRYSPLLDPVRLGMASAIIEPVPPPKIVRSERWVDPLAGRTVSGQMKLVDSDPVVNEVMDCFEDHMQPFLHCRVLFDTDYSAMLGLTALTTTFGLEASPARIDEVISGRPFDTGSVTVTDSYAYRDPYRAAGQYPRAYMNRSAVEAIHTQEDTRVLNALGVAALLEDPPEES